MSLTKLLIANRGEVAVRVLRAAHELGIETVSIFAEDDEQSLHVRLATESCGLAGHGAAAYLDGTQVLEVAKQRGCDAIHTGWGFLAENAEFAAACEEAGITFVGPTAAVLELLGDKTRARALAEEQGVPVLPASPYAVSAEEAAEFFRSLGDGDAMVIKAVAGGGGRGMRVVESAADVQGAFERCQSEAKAAFGDDAVYVEQLMRRARHVEIQVVGDGTGAHSHSPLSSETKFLSVLPYQVIHPPTIEASSIKISEFFSFTFPPKHQVSGSAELKRLIYD